MQPERDFSAGKLANLGIPEIFSARDGFTVSRPGNNFRGAILRIY
jgi:hypothetical protein